MPVNNKPKELGSLGLLCFKRIDFKTNLVDIVSNEIVIDGNSSEINIALLEDKKLVELSKEKSNVEFAVGNIFLAKVKKIMPGLNAAFIDVGYEKDAFLHYLDLGPQFNSLKKYVSQVLSKKTKSASLSKFKREKDIDKGGKITHVLQSGQPVLVQVTKEPISSKGPRLTSEISIPGRNLVLIPFADKVNISSKIKSVEERKRLKRLVESIKPNNFGVIVRTVAEGKKVAVLDQELKSLVQKWESEFDNINGKQLPKLIISELNRTSAILRDMLNVSYNHIYVNDNTIYHEIREYLSEIAPEKENIVKLYKGKESIFEHYGLDKQIKSSFGKTVSFKNGAYLIIEHTEALHVIDVNSGNRSKGADQETNALEVNLAAAEEIARQLRLRDMGGIIVVDFIDMTTSENKVKLFEKMKECMATDRTKHNILPLSKFGLMQITRQRVRPEMLIETAEQCPTCKGQGKVAPSILFDEELENHICYLAIDRTYKKLTLKVHPFIAAYLNKGLISIKYKWARKYKIKLNVEAVKSHSYMEYRFFDVNEQEILF